jgi:hypothetical protein
MSNHATLDIPAPVTRAVRTPPASLARPRRGGLGLVRALVATALFVLLVAGAVRYGADPRVDLALAAAWTALLVLVWELGAQALALHRRGPAR